MSHPNDELPRFPGRWILSPKRSARFMGPRARARVRARERRRQVIVFLLECMAVSLLIGAFPPLRPMLVVTAALTALLIVYLWMAWRLAGVGRASAATVATEPERPRPARPRLLILPEAQPREEETASVRVAAR